MPADPPHGAPARCLRIAMIGQRGVPASYGGIETAVEELGAELAARGHAVTVYCRRGYGDDSLGSYRGMALVHLPSVEWKGVGAFLHAGLSTAHALRQRPDIMHFHGIGPGLFALFPRIASRAGIVQTVHAMDNQRDKWGRVGRKVLGLGAWSASRMPHVTLVVGRDLGEVYRRRWGRATTHVPNGVRPPPSDIKSDEVEAIGLVPGGYLLFVGRIVPEKGVDVLMRAFKRLRDDLGLVIVGPSGDSDDYARAVRDLALTDPRIRVIGYVPYHSALREQLYAHARAAVFPSALEGHPIALLEASAFGLPVVASTIGPHVEILGPHDEPGRRLFPPGDEDGLVAAVSRCLDGGSAESAGAAEVRAQVLTRYSWGDAATQTVAAYFDALQARRPLIRRPQR